MLTIKYKIVFSQNIFLNTNTNFKTIRKLNQFKYINVLCSKMFVNDKTLKINSCVTKQLFSNENVLLCMLFKNHIFFILRWVQLYID